MMEWERNAPGDPTNQPPFRIEDYLVLPALNRIEHEAETFQIEPRVMRVLVCLAARPNEVLSRQTLFDTVWADSVVCEEALTRTIYELRRVFRDGTKPPRVIETIRKGGYRLIAPVTPVAAPAMPEEVPDPAAPSPAPDPPSREETPLPPVRRRGRRRALVGVIGLALVTLVPLSLWTARRVNRGADSDPTRSDPTPLTSYPGVELFPALSPDGSKVAFSWARTGSEDDDQLDVYVMQVGSGAPVRLTDLPGSEKWPSWSPDGAEIAFSSEANGEREICVVPVLGGSVRRMARVGSPIFGLSWSPDGRSIAYAAADTLKAAPRIRLLSLENLSRRSLTSPPLNFQGDLGPVFSPDGGSVAFIRINELRGTDAYVVPVAGGEARKLNMGGMRVSGIDWLSSRDVAISAASKIDYGLWKVPLGSGERRRLSPTGGMMQRLSVARTGRRLAYEKISLARNIRGADISRSGEVRRRQAPLLASTQKEWEPAFSPDGRSIAFVSDRSGAPEIWVADAAGGDPRRVTNHQTTQMTRPRWSPDGMQIAYCCSAGGPSSIYIAELRSQLTRRVMPGGTQVLSFWSRQGDKLYYQLDAPGGWEVWSVHPDGSGRTRVSEPGYTAIEEASDGRSLLCLKSGGQGIWRLPVDGSEPMPVVPPDRCKDWEETIAVEEGIYFLRRGRDALTLGFYEYATARADSLASLEWYAASPALSPDRSMLLYDCVEKIEIDLMLAEVPE